jgi:hypothetical protein
VAYRFISALRKMALTERSSWMRRIASPSSGPTLSSTSLSPRARFLSSARGIVSVTTTRLIGPVGEALCPEPGEDGVRRGDDHFARPRP